MAKSGTPQPDRNAIERGAHSFSGCLFRIIDRRKDAKFCRSKIAHRAGQRVVARLRQSARQFQGGVGEVSSIDQGCFRQSQRAGFVKNDGVHLGHALDHITRFHQYAPPKQSACGHDLHGGCRQSQRAGAGDDEDGNRDDDGIVHACPHRDPAHCGQACGNMHDRRIDLRHAVGKLHIGAFNQKRLVDQPLDIGEQSCRSGGCYLDLQHGVTIERSGENAVAYAHRFCRRLTGDKAFVDLRCPAANDAIGGKTLAGSDQH